MNFKYHKNEWWWGHSITIVTEDGSGYVNLQQENGIEDEMCISNLSVLEEQRHKGIGTALLAEAERVAKDYGMKRIYLSAEKGSFVVDWYERIGYTKDKYRNKHLYRLTKELK